MVDLGKRRAWACRSSPTRTRRSVLIGRIIMSGCILNIYTILELIIKCLIGCFIFEITNISGECIRVKFDVIQIFRFIRLERIGLISIIPIKWFIVKMRIGKDARAIFRIGDEQNILQRSVEMGFMTCMLLILAQSIQLLLMLLRFSQTMLLTSFNNYLSMILRGCFLLLLNVNWLIDA